MDLEVQFSLRFFVMSHLTLLLLPSLPSSSFSFPEVLKFSQCKNHNYNQSIPSENYTEKSNKTVREKSLKFVCFHLAGSCRTNDATLTSSKMASSVFELKSI